MENKEQLNKEKVRFQLDLSEDILKAYLTIYITDEDELCDKQEVMDFLASKKITYGIQETVIDEIIDQEKYLSRILVAEGDKPQAGKNGFYDYFFETNPQVKPIILEDGSVDYNTLGEIVLVKAGDLLAVYTPAQQGIEGKNVLGIPVPPPKAKDLQVLKGKGFDLSEDGLTYTANRDGKAELYDNRLIINELLVIDNADSTTGDINFSGDILVSGNVTSHVVIKANGNITVNGHVETARIHAGKSVILRNGVQGADETEIYAVGDISAKFFEQCKVCSKGYINANAILNCEIQSNKEVIVSGHQGIIVGGMTKAIEKVSASIIGNRAEVATYITVGVDVNLAQKIKSIDDEISVLTEDLEKIDTKLERLNEKLKKNSLDIIKDSKNEALRYKIKLQSQINSEKAKREEMIDQFKRSADSRIVAEKKMYQNTVVMINGARMELAGSCQNVTLRKEEGEIHIYSNV